ncbi:MAG: adenylate/guanylate cyclase domain-containing protein [Betaproteobacteria bacterium]|nr:adenylate/guanylate cyclase domain-containing protein [Betaproteobacteria bacterium]
MERKLAAVLEADVVGYSRLMGLDEAGTLGTLKSHLREVIEPAVAQRRGRIVNTTGDAFLAEFPSVVDAVECSVEMQAALEIRNAGLPEDRKMRFRMGINLGDVMVEGSDIYGDGVNVAARLESLAPAGGICISQPVHELVGSLGLSWEDAGEQFVKNIAKPVRAYRLQSAAPATRLEKPAPSAGRRFPLPAVAMVSAAVVFVGGLGFWGYQGRYATPPAAERSTANLKPALAVLPFNNMSEDPKQEYFSDGITEDLITDLSKLSGLFVIARNSSFVYKGKPVNVPQVGKELGVRYVLEGSVRKAGKVVRITAQLIDAATGHHLWAERYDRDLTGVFDVQDDVRQKIVAALAVKLTAGEKEQWGRKPTNNPEAYDLWARGLEQQAAFNREGILEARRLFLRAVELDPAFARAYGQIANTYTTEWEMGWSGSPAELLETAVSFAQRAVALDDALPQAHWVLSRAYAQRKKYDEALAEIEKAVALNPNFADGHAYLAQVLVYGGRAEEALRHVEEAMRINPRAPYWYVYIQGHAQFMLGRYDAAVATLKLSLERNANYQATRRVLIAAYGQAGMKSEAEWEIAEYRVADPSATIGRLREISPIRDAKYLERYVEGLRKAGVPE